MSLPEPGVTVTAIVAADLHSDDEVYAALGNVINAADWGVSKPNVLWEPTTRNFRLTLLEEEEGIMWARGVGKEVEGALLAAYRLR